MPINPIRMTEDVLEKYRSYLLTTFHLSDPELHGKFQEEIEKENALCKGPYIERLSRYRTGKSIGELVREGILSEIFLRIDQETLPSDRPLYAHQEMAVRKAVVQKKSFIVSAGTGSGKTESFLIPVLNYLFRQIEESKLTPGVRALLLYPMNALANDQLLRLRSILKRIPEVTFGIYTGETEQEEKSALSRFVRLFAHDPLPNELISRARMRGSPPHLLITNYAMLEYLLLRPDDCVFFDGEHARFWKFLILDEVHTYGGAKGIETALLLRRLAHRIGRSAQGQALQYFGTSASLGYSPDACSKLAQFAQNLFHTRVEWDKNDPERQDIIVGEKLPYTPRELQVKAGPITIPPEFYTDLIAYFKGEANSLVTEKLSRWIGETIGNRAHNPDGSPTLKRAEGPNAPFDLSDTFLRIVENDEKVKEVNRILESGPCEFSKLTEILFPKDAQREVLSFHLVLLINLVCHLFPQTSLSSMKYHLFLKALEGAFVSFYPDKTLQLERKTIEKMDDSSTERLFFEIGSCKNCGAVYLTGTVDKDTGILRQTEYDQTEGDEFLDWYLLIEPDRAVAENEDEEDGASEERDTRNLFQICPRCGKVSQENLIGNACDCGVALLSAKKAKSKEGRVNKCLNCGAQSSLTPVLWRFLDGADASGSVIATALFQNLYSGLSPEERKRQNGFIVFSDSRQGAAYFAPYLQESYDRIFWRRILVNTLETYREKAIENDWIVKNLAEFAKKRLPEDYQMDKQTIETTAYLWTQYEAMSYDRRTGLEGAGLLGFKVPLSKGLYESLEKRSPLLNAPWNLTPEEAHSLYQLLLSSFRKCGALTYLPDIEPEHEFFAPRNLKTLMTLSAQTQAGVKSWVPYRFENARSDYLRRLFPKARKEEVPELLQWIWKEFDHPDWRDCFETSFTKRNQSGKRLKIDALEILSPLLTPDMKLYQCDRCKELFFFAVRGVCPSYGCQGTVRETNFSALGPNHYRDLYRTLELSPLRVEEHTAQLKYEKAREFQEDFYHKKIQILSCSTTFELGVDVGDLDTIFLKNVPPTASNYLQRAGRAGRRTSNPAFILTYALRRPHDRYFFSDPEKMIKGEIAPPSFVLENEKIRYRHMAAIALAEYWRQYPNHFKDVKAFFFPETDDDLEGVARFEHFVATHQEELDKTIRETIPATEHELRQKQFLPWAYLLFSDSPVTHASLYHIGKELKEDIRVLTDLIDAATKKRTFRKADTLHRKVQTLLGRNLMQYLAGKGILPRYGFPVDVIELMAPFDEKMDDLELSRDMKTALWEYAPDNPVYANKQKWSTQYIKKVPDKALIEESYAFCRKCGFSKVSIKERSTTKTCKICGSQLNVGDYLFPEFGFISGQPEKAGVIKKTQLSQTRCLLGKEEYTIEEKTLLLRYPVHLKTMLGNLVTINPGGPRGFNVCLACGYSDAKKTLEREHNNPQGKRCPGKIARRKALGYQFKTEILEITPPENKRTNDEKEYWLSILYALLEGVSLFLDIDRNDLDGIVFPVEGRSYPNLLLFDNVAGGAGHIRWCMEDGAFEGILKLTESFLKGCLCGGEEGDSSCYGCLRNYTNQRYHEILKRKYAVEWIEEMLEGGRE
ncbi:MAG TPA: DEAD/DEAH box helicase [Thermotogota bacterium]|nr:MAG: ATP-dependent RNA helicase RhlE [Thermotogota bacterium ADurb.Bin062]HNY81561.1 DEAD/DEAH box helicase [Thermotogota bacterium]HOD90080.1 DEAD/DEAH box helicase [Thermotogota bacterium]HOX64210.1 DEAD/DEAH box helicase [Thermotogota bacterium]HPG97317.1 DEAD/DEAH box helicase [Thermotogota bacterium]